VKPVTHHQIETALADALAAIETSKVIEERLQYRLRVLQQSCWILGVAALMAMLGWAGTIAALAAGLL
jgi:hypothetical protein